MNDTIVTLELSPKLQQEKVITNYIYDSKTNCLVLELNHKNDKTTIVSKIIKDDWTKTIERFEHETKRKGVSQQHIAMITDVAENQYQDILPAIIDDNLDGGLIF